MENTRKSSIGIMLIVLIVLVAISGGVYLYMAQKTKVIAPPVSELVTLVDSTNCVNEGGRIKDLCEQEEFIYLAVKNKDPNLCIEGATNQYPIDSAWESGVREEKEKIKEGSIERCYLKIAATYNDLSYCHLLPSESYMKSMCYQEIAYQTNNLEMCNNPSYFPTQIKKDYCYWGVAGNSKNSAMCGEISDETAQSLCYVQSRSSLEMIDPSYCEKVKVDGERNSCYYTTAISLRDKELCKKLTMGSREERDPQSIEDNQKACEKDIDSGGN